MVALNGACGFAFRFREFVFEEATEIVEPFVSDWVWICFTALDLTGGADIGGHAATTSSFSEVSA